MALSLFLYWLRSSWQATTMPVGMWVMRMAEEVLFTCWPPAPEERNTCISMSAGFSWTSAVSISGRTATVAVEVWMRPPDSVSGTRWTRWTPLSYFRRDQAPSPSIVKEISFKPPNSVSLAESTSVLQPRDSAYMEYMR